LLKDLKIQTVGKRVRFMTILKRFRHTCHKNSSIERAHAEATAALSPPLPSPKHNNIASSHRHNPPLPSKDEYSLAWPQTRSPLAMSFPEPYEASIPMSPADLRPQPNIKHIAEVTCGCRAPC
jgi:hypothetical protein